MTGERRRARGGVWTAFLVKRGQARSEREFGALSTQEEEEEGECVL